MFNNKTCILLLIALGCISLSYGATFMGDGTNPDDLEHCHIPLEDGSIFKVPAGTEKTDKENCVRYTCGDLSLSKKLYYEGATCPTLTLYPGHVLMYDESKSYPECCPYVVKQEEVEKEKKVSIWRKIWKKITRS